jgi:hypothetical protein
MDRRKKEAVAKFLDYHRYNFKANDPPSPEDSFEAGWDAASLQFRVDVFCIGGWKYLASFVGETDAYEYGERYSTLGARVWNRGVCIATTSGPRSWHAPPHNRDCDGNPCECGAVPPLGSMHQGG